MKSTIIIFFFFFLHLVGCGDQSYIEQKESTQTGKLSDDNVINLNAFYEDLKNFNYADMDNLKIDSEDVDGMVSCWKAVRMR